MLVAATRPVLPARWMVKAETELGAIQAIIGLLLTAAGLVGGWFVALRTQRSEERRKKAEVDSARDIRFVDMGEHLIDTLSAQVKELQGKHDGHTEQILSLYKEIHQYKAQCTELTEKVTLQTLQLQEQDLKLNEQAITIEGLRRDNTSLREINRELMAQVRNEMQTELAERELLADVAAADGKGEENGA